MSFHAGILDLASARAGGMTAGIGEAEWGGQHGWFATSTAGGDLKVRKGGQRVAVLDGGTGLRGKPHLSETEVLDRAEEGDTATFLSLLRSLTGEFALVHCDLERATVVLARSSEGSRPLYYGRANGWLAWSSSLSFVADVLDAFGEISDEYLAQYLTTAYDPVGTPYLGVHCVRPGSALVACEHEVREDSFSTPVWKSHGATDDPGDAAEVYLSKIQAAVDARASTGSLFEFSGGMDSSSLVCVAARLADARGEERAVETATFVYDLSASADERAYRDAVAGRYRLHGHLIEDEEILSLELPFAPSLPDTSLAFASGFGKCARIQRELGNRPRVTGIGGDEVHWAGDDEAVMASIVSSHGVLRGLKSALDLARAKRRSLFFALGQAARGLARRSIGSVQVHENAPYLLALLSPSFRAYTCCEDRFRVSESLVREFGPAQAQVRAWLAQAMWYAAQCSDRDYFGVSLSYPYLDVDFAPFVLNAPISTKADAESNRLVQRRALQEILPKALLGRKTKQGPDEPLLRAIGKNWEKLTAALKSSEVIERGIVERLALEAALSAARHGQRSVHLLTLWRVLALEIWFKNRPRSDARLRGLRRALGGHGDDFETIDGRR